MAKTQQNQMLGSSLNARKGGESNSVMCSSVSVAVVESVAEYQAMHCTCTEMSYPEFHHIRELESSKDALARQLPNHVTRIFLAQRTSV
jgi:hypothetical protein